MFFPFLRPRCLVCAVPTKSAKRQQSWFFDDGTFISSLPKSDGPRKTKAEPTWSIVFANQWNDVKARTAPEPVTTPLSGHDENEPHPSGCLPANPPPIVVLSKMV